MTLVDGYYLSQIILTGIVALAAIGTSTQLQTFKRFELMKYLEDPRIRKARRLLFYRLRSPKEPPPARWWESDEELEEAAATVCSSYDIVGIMATGTNHKFFKKEWAYNICWTYDALSEYLRERHQANQNLFHGYRELYDAAKPFASRN
jgi:hypothetical protein